MSPLGCLASLFGVKEKPAAVPEPTNSTVPDALPVEVKRYFFSRDENAFFGVLEEVLAGTPYRVFPNVRLNDLFRIRAEAQRGAVYARLRDKHVDFLIVNAAEAFRPVLALELDGASHGSEKQQHRDAVKDVAFRSAGLKLLRLPSRAYSAAELGGRLGADLPALQNPPAPRRYP
ncbi:DUF2726 domain-containing protein [Deinococcus budaensis]|uniref:DUF2726 domain-containing protein n=1 Tax=Deinococcus budaensis TaxID=1665626 RepID=A0A7W8LNI4_9DEIO|nr:DUF2726 domain-containing protein [Deinococcus budaensis]MBB5232746.1 hypothetical protein [Deinococcus budaensis]